MSQSPDPREDTSSRGPWAVWIAALAASAALALHAWAYLPFISDDAFISLRYAERLVEGRGLTWTDGPRVEGYSNLLWVLACAAMKAAGVDLIAAARFWGFAGMIIAICGAAFGCRGRGLAGPLIAGLLMAIAAPIAVWTVGGLEQPFVAALLAWTIAVLLPTLSQPRVARGDLLAPSLLLGLLCLTRADGAVLCIAVAAGLIAARGWSAASIRCIASLAVWPVVFGGGQLIFRRAYYGEWVPNSALVKVAFTPERLTGGAKYLWAAAPYLAPLILMAAAAAWSGIRAARSRPIAVFLIVGVSVWLVYVVVIGGDIFPAHRHWIPAIVFMAIAVGRQMRAEWANGSPWRGRLGVLVAASLLVFAVCQRLDPSAKLAMEEQWEWDGQEVGEMLQRAFGRERPLLACDSAGCLPYFSKLPSLDMLGLNDRHIARHARPGFGQEIIGHDVGDGAYVLSREPDLVIFRLPTGTYEPLYPSGMEMFADPGFKQRYRFAVLRTAGPRSVYSGVWFRISSAKVGVVTQGSRTLIPGYLGSTSESTAAILDSQGRLGALLGVEPIKLEGFVASPGRTVIETESDTPCQIVVRAEGRTEPIAQGTGRVEFRLEPAEDVRFGVELRALDSAKPVHLRNLVMDHPPAG